MSWILKILQSAHAIGRNGHLLTLSLILRSLFWDIVPKLTSRICLPNTIQQVHIEECRRVELSGIMQHYHGNLRLLEINKGCDSVNSIVLDYFPMLEVLSLESCENLESLTSSEQPHPPLLPFLTRFQLKDCPKFVSFPQGGLHAPDLKDFCIEDCNLLRSLPQHMHTLLPSLRLLSISNCPELESFPECGLPSKSEHLEISNCNKLFSDHMRWNLQTLTCFYSLKISNMDELVLHSFPEEGLLPTTLTCLAINSLPHLKALNGNAFRQLSSLKRLEISRCQELQCLPEGLPASLSVLTIYDCPLLNQRCQRNNGEDWHKISHVAHIKLDYNSIWWSLSIKMCQLLFYFTSFLVVTLIFLHYFIIFTFSFIFDIIFLFIFCVIQVTLTNKCYSYPLF